MLHCDFHEVDLHNLECEVDDHHKHFIHEYSHLDKKNKYNEDLQIIRDSRRNSMLSTNSMQLDKKFFSTENLTLSL